MTNSDTVIHASMRPEPLKYKSERALERRAEKLDREEQKILSEKQRKLELERNFIPDKETQKMLAKQSGANAKKQKEAEKRALLKRLQDEDL